MSTLSIDWKRCRGHGVCAAAFGERISSDRWGYPTMPLTIEVPLEQEHAARMAVATCPAAALRLRSS